MSGWTTLIAAETLAMALNRPDVVVIDCRFSLMSPGAGEVAYQRGHIPGAFYAHLDRDLSDQRKQGQGRHPWPDAADFTAKLGQWGVSRDTQVAIYDDGDGAYAARLWFLLKALGHEKAAVLDGGWLRWTSLGLPADSRPAKPMHPRRYVATFDQTRLLDADQVQDRLAAGDLLIDARGAERFRGESEPIDKIAGHVPGARNRPFTSNLTDGKFKSPVQLAAELRELLGEHAPENTIVMCGSGVTACHHLLAMERAGIRGARLFTGSWSGWISDPNRPVATGPE